MPVSEEEHGRQEYVLARLCRVWRDAKQLVDAAQLIRRGQYEIRPEQMVALRGAVQSAGELLQTEGVR